MSAHTNSEAWRLTERVRVSGGEVATGVFGEGPPVVLVHGTPAWSYLWREVVPVLARNHTVYVWDLLGFGDSRNDPGIAPSIARQAQTLAELVAHWGIESPILVGHDIGGGIVLRAHLIEGVPARRLALLDAAVLGPWNTPFTEHLYNHADVYRTMPPHIFADIIAPRMRTTTHRAMPDDVANAYLAPWAGPDGQQRWVDQATAVHFDDARDVVDRLDQIITPTLVLWGEHDTWLDPTTGDRLAAAIPGHNERHHGRRTLRRRRPSTRHRTSTAELLRPSGDLTNIVVTLAAPPVIGNLQATAFICMHPQLPRTNALLGFVKIQDCDALLMQKGRRMTFLTPLCAGG